jgi:hypothetical protein
VIGAETDDADDDDDDEVEDTVVAVADPHVVERSVDALLCPNTYGTRRNDRDGILALLLEVPQHTSMVRRATMILIVFLMT